MSEQQRAAQAESGGAPAAMPLTPPPAETAATPDSALAGKGAPPQPPAHSTGIYGQAKALLTQRTQGHVRAFFICFLLGGVAWMAVVSCGSGDWRTLGALGFLSASGMIVGGFVGFLFGVPRSLSSTAAALATTSGSGQPGKIVANTNLEQISDWLTKVLVGVGLTQLQSLPTLLGELSAAVSTMLPGVEGPGALGVAVLATYFFAGFLWSYLESRTALMELFERQG